MYPQLVLLLAFFCILLIFSEKGWSLQKPVNIHAKKLIKQKSKSNTKLSHQTLFPWGNWQGLQSKTVTEKYLRKDSQGMSRHVRWRLLFVLKRACQALSSRIKSFSLSTISYRFELLCCLKIYYTRRFFMQLCMIRLGWNKLKIQAGFTPSKQHIQ